MTQFPHEATPAAAGMIDASGIPEPIAHLVTTVVVIGTMLHVLVTQKKPDKASMATDLAVVVTQLRAQWPALFPGDTKTGE